ncbi:MAG: 50S ribosomal protein L21 [Actinobacteria bacterium]|nr:50S ribosomal protein L21 [Actinomycetota bacterium]
MTYAIIALGGKQYRVSEGQRLLVDRLPHDEGATFTPDVLLVGGDGDPKLGADAAKQKVTALVSAHVLGKKVIVGKHRQRTGYRKRNGHRSRLSQIEIQSIGAATRKRTTKKPESEGKSE